MHMHMHMHMHRGFWTFGFEISAQCATNGTKAQESLGPRLRFSTTWWRGQDLNLRPSGYEPDELPDCSTPRCKCPLYRNDVNSKIDVDDTTFPDSKS